MTKSFFCSVKECTRVILAIFIVSGITFSGSFGKSVSIDANSLFVVADSGDALIEAEKLWASINFNEIESEVRASLNLSLMDGTLFWEYLQPTIYQDQLDFLNGGYKSVAAATLPEYIANLKQSYLNKYNAFLNDKTSFMQQLAGQGSNERVQQVNGPCLNIGFETGTTNGWTTYRAQACSSATQTPCQTVAGPNSRINIKTAGTDPFVPAISMVPPGATYSLMLEDYLNGRNASRISQTFLVTPANNVLTYKYAAVLEDPGHPKPESPYFKVNLNAADGSDISCGDYTAIAFPPILNFDSLPADSNIFINSDPVGSGYYIDIYYRNWTTVSIPLDKYIGKNVTITFTASDCALGGHRGYAYIWAECSSVNNMSICLDETLSVSAPPGFAAYKWKGPGIVGTNSTRTIQVDEPGKYSLLITPFSDNPCPDSIYVDVLEHCSPKPIVDTVCETVKGSKKALDVNLTKFDSIITIYNSAGVVQNWYAALPPTVGSKINNPADITVSNGSKYYAVITYPSLGIGGDTAEIEFGVAGRPTVILPPQNPYCAGGAPYQITGETPPGGVFYGKDISASGLFKPPLAKSDTINYIYTNRLGCKDTTKQILLARTPPTVSAPQELYYCNDTANSISFEASSPNNVKYYWQSTNDTTQKIVVSDSGTYTVIVTDKYNCVDTAQTIVKLVCPPKVYVSSAFSPNNDGSNDIYNVYSDHVGAFHMLIFNRWGEIIFESRNKNYFWNGIYREDLMPIGVYPWVIDYQGDSEQYKGPYTMKGSVTVVR